MSLKAWLVALAVARGADAASSCAAFARGAQEGTPWLSTSCPATIGVQIGATVLQGWALQKLSAAGHPKIAAILAAVTISVEVGSTVHNQAGR